MFKFLQGKKTYIVAALIAAVNIAYLAGTIDEQTKNTLLGLLGAGAVGTVAAKMNRMQKDVEKKDF